MENVELLSPLVDIIFKAIFANPKNTDILSAFIKSVLNIDDSDFDSLEITDTNLKAEEKDDKVGILDVKVYTKDGKIINVEVQVAPSSELRERIVFYTSKMITEQINKGDNYEKIKKVISIVILEFKLIKENTEYHNIFRLYDKDTQTTLTDVLEIHTLELLKLPQVDDNTDLSYWLQFFKARRKEEFSMLAERSPMLQKAYEELETLSQDKSTREVYELRLKAKRDEISRLKYAEHKGKTEGKAEGKAEIIRNMLNRKLSLSDIAALTGLSESEVQALQQDTAIHEVLSY